jgi:hypothetical protein
MAWHPLLRKEKPPEDGFSNPMRFRDGPTIQTKSGIREHPLLKHQLGARSFIVRSLHRLGLEIEPAQQHRATGGTVQR